MQTRQSILMQKEQSTNIVNFAICGTSFHSILMKILMNNNTILMLTCQDEYFKCVR